MRRTKMVREGGYLPALLIPFRDSRLFFHPSPFTEQCCFVFTKPTHSHSSSVMHLNLYAAFHMKNITVATMMSKLQSNLCHMRLIVFRHYRINGNNRTRNGNVTPDDRGDGSPPKAENEKYEKTKNSTITTLSAVGVRAINYTYSLRKMLYSATGLPQFIFVI